MAMLFAFVQTHPFMAAYVVLSVLGHIPKMPGATYFNRLALNLKPKADAESK